MGLGDRRRGLMHRNMPAHPDADCAKKRSRKIRFEPVREELDNLQFVLPPELIVPHRRLIHGDTISAAENAPEKLPPVSEAEVDSLVQACAEAYDRERLDDLLKDCRSKVIEGIVIPFGLGGIVAHYDKDGGNVDTVHNVREGVYATEAERTRFAARGEYDSAEYHGHANYRRTNAQAKEGPVQDAYGRGTVKGQQNLDHVVSAKRTHDDPGRVLAELDGADLANAESNIKFTNEHVNKGKRDLSMDHYIANRKARISVIRDQISALEKKSRSEGLNPSQRQSLANLKKAEEKFKADGFDEKRAREADRKARAEMEKTIGRAYYGSGKFVKSLARTSATEGVKMGWQQAFGLALTEFFIGIIDEARDAYRNGFKLEDKGFWQSLKERFMRVVRRVVSRWRDALDAFKKGALSGFLSNLVTVLINCVVRTGRNVVRMIREGVFSLVRAVKVLCVRPNGMTLREAAHEAMKILASGLVVAGGVLLAEWLDKMIVLVPWLEVVSDILVAIVSGVVTGIASALVVYAIDQLDPFDVNARKKHASIMRKLADMVEGSLTNAEAMLAEMDEGLARIQASAVAAAKHAARAEVLADQIRSFGKDSVFL